MALATCRPAMSVWRVRLRIENLTRLDAGRGRPMDRRAALERSLLSTHAMRRGVRRPIRLAARGEGPGQGRGRLPQHQQLAGARHAFGRRGARRGDLPSRSSADRAREQVNFFDNTEIEEALMLHVQVFSDDGARGDRRTGRRGARDVRAGGGGVAGGASPPARDHEARGRRGPDRQPPWMTRAAISRT